jgi:hypothetical protein
VRKSIDQQGNDHIHRQYQYEDIEWMQGLPLLDGYTHDKQFLL